MRKRAKKRIFPKVILVVLVLMLLTAIVYGGLKLADKISNKDNAEEASAPVYTEVSGYLASATTNTTVHDRYMYPIDCVPRGTFITGLADEKGITCFEYEGNEYYINKSVLKQSLTECVLPSTAYVRTTVNLLSENGKLLSLLANKGDKVEIIGCNGIIENGEPNLFKVIVNGGEGYMAGQYMAKTEALANMIYNHNGYYDEVHSTRPDEYGGGSADNLDYFPREKGNFENNVMPDECRTLYICSWRVDEVDTYLEVAKDTAINAFCVDITDGTAIGYSSPVMEQYSPTTAKAAYFTAEEYASCIKKIKDAGYYVIGRITTFNDEYFLEDHPECAIMNLEGRPFNLQGTYWPSGYNRYAWQYKVDLALEAVELMGFNEIQFDYVRFPDMTDMYDSMGIIDYGNTYGETKAQAIQRFLMYATDRIHEAGAYVSADVFGESAFTYVTAYGQYWPAISTVVDAVSGMPYPDHFGSIGDYKPWEHPYDTLYNWGSCVAIRQEETASPAKVRTWIQAYDAILEPYNTYGANEIAAQINGLKDSGVFDGFLTWHSGAEPYKYLDQADGFAA